MGDRPRDRSSTADAPSGRARSSTCRPSRPSSYDIERNLRAPLAGSRAPPAEPRRAATPGWTSEPATPRSAIASVRSFATPADILVTTPESLFLHADLGGPRRTLRTVEAVIVDEIHAARGRARRGTPTSRLSLERLEPPRRRAIRSASASPPRSVPLDDVAMLPGRRPAGRRSSTPAPPPTSTLHRSGARSPTWIRSPRRSRRRPKRTKAVPVLSELARQEMPPASEPGSIWSRIHPEIVDLIRAHRTTIVFVEQPACSCERLCNKRFNELAGEELALTHHGKHLARQAGSEIEEDLKAGTAQGCLVATSLAGARHRHGAAVDLVMLRWRRRRSVASRPAARGSLRPRRRASGARGVVVPEVQAATCSKSSGRGRSGCSPGGDRAARDHRAADCSRRPRAAGRRDGRRCGPVTVAELEAVIRETVSSPYAEPVRRRRAARRARHAERAATPPTSSRTCKPRICPGTVPEERADRHAKAPEDARRSSTPGTIPDRGLYAVHLGVEGGPRDRRAGRGVWSTRARKGDTIVLGASTWRVEDDHPRPGGGRAGTRVSRGKASVLAGGRSRAADRARPRRSARSCARWRRCPRTGRRFTPSSSRASTPLDERRRRPTSSRYHRRPAGAHLGVPARPTGQITVECFRDEIGDWRVCVLTPVRRPGPRAVGAGGEGRAHPPVSGSDVYTMWTDDGIVLRFADVPRSCRTPTRGCSSIADEVEDRVVEEVRRLGDVRVRAFRENAARALAPAPPRRPDKPHPAVGPAATASGRSLLGVASPASGRSRSSWRRTASACRTCSIVPALVERDARASGARTRCGWTSWRHRSASPFARSLVFAYVVATFLYEYDAPLAERKAQALTLDRATCSASSSGRRSSAT